MKAIEQRKPSEPTDGYAGSADFITPWADPPKMVIDLTGTEPVIWAEAPINDFSTSSHEWATALAEARAEIAEMKEEIRHLKAAAAHRDGA